MATVCKVYNLRAFRIVAREPKEQRLDWNLVRMKDASNRMFVASKHRPRGAVACTIGLIAATASDPMATRGRAWAPIISQSEHISHARPNCA